MTYYDKRKKAGWQVVLFTILTSFGATSYGDNAGLKLTTSLTKESVVIGEPVYMTATLTNTTPNPALIFPSLHLEDGALRIMIRKGDIRHPFVPYSLDLTDLKLTELAEGDSISAAFPVFYGGRGWTFPSEGTYQIEGVFTDPSNGEAIAKSAPVELSVSKDDGSGELLVDGSKGSSEAGKFLLWQSGDHLRAGIAHLQELIDQYPNSVVSDHARLAFASSLSRPFRDYGTGKLRKPDPEGALNYLKMIDPNRLSSYSEVWRINTELRSQTLLGNDTQIQTLRRQAAEIVENNPALRQLVESVDQ